MRDRRGGLQDQAAYAKLAADKRYETFIARWKRGLEPGMKGSTGISSHIRRYLFEKYESKCARCAWNKVHTVTGKVPLEVEHLDGDFKNNKEENLELICPNCHSLTATYRSLNKGKGRPRNMASSVLGTNRS